MPAYRLKNLTLKNFRSFTDAFIEFDESGLMLLGGDSGAGKSSIPIAISIALGNSHFSIKDQRTWGSKSPMSVGLEFETSLGTWKVIRGDKSILHTPSGETITGTAAVDTRLALEFGVSLEILGALTYRKQKQAGLFLSMTDSEKKEFLSGVLDLDKYEKAIELSASEIKALETQISNRKFALQGLDARARSLPDIQMEEVNTWPIEVAIDELRQEIDKMQLSFKNKEESLNGLRLSQSAIEKEISALFEERLRDAKNILAEVNVKTFKLVESEQISELKRALEQAESMLKKLRESDRLSQKNFDIQRDSLRLSIKNLQSKADAKVRLVADKQRTESNLKKLSESICPTCSQEWSQNQAQEKAWRTELESILAGILAADQAAADIMNLTQEERTLVWNADPRIVRFEEIVMTIKGDIREEEGKTLQQRISFEAAKKQEAMAASLAISNLANEQTATVATRCSELVALSQVLEQEIRDLLVSINKQNSVLSEQQLKLRMISSENVARKKAFEASQADKAKLTSEIASNSEKLKELESSLAAEQDFSDLIGNKGFLGAIFEDILNEISQETNVILSAVANTSNVTIHFSSESLTAKGIVRKEIRPVVSINGFVANLDSGPSGGMRTTIDLAVDLALANIIQRRANSAPGFLILDEAWEGLDLPSRGNCLDLLSQNANERLFIVIDHASETGQRFSKVVDVNIQNGISSISERGDQ